jgi:hypothetical protein
MIHFFSFSIRLGMQGQVLQEMLIIKTTILQLRKCAIPTSRRGGQIIGRIWSTTGSEPVSHIKKKATRRLVSLQVHLRAPPRCRRVTFPTSANYYAGIKTKIEG